MAVRQVMCISFFLSISPPTHNHDKQGALHSNSPIDFKDLHFKAPTTLQLGISNLTLLCWACFKTQVRDSEITNRKNIYLPNLSSDLQSFLQDHFSFLIKGVG